MRLRMKCSTQRPDWAPTCRRSSKPSKKEIARTSTNPKTIGNSTASTACPVIRLMILAAATRATPTAFESRKMVSATGSKTNKPPTVVVFKKVQVVSFVQDRHLSRATSNTKFHEPEVFHPSGKVE